MEKEPIITVQQTSKKIKTHFLISFALVILGIITTFYILIPIGICWYIGSRLARWWNHG